MKTTTARRYHRHLRLEQLESRQLLATVSGIVFNDADGSGSQDPGELPLADWTVFLDENQNTIADAGEPVVTTGSDGAYTFSLPVLPTGKNYHVQALVPPGEATGRFLNTTVNYDFAFVPAGSDPALTLDFGFKFVPYSTFAPQGSEALVNQTTAGQQGGRSDLGYASDHARSLAADGNGNYVVVWGVPKTATTPHQVFARVFNADGSPRTNEFKVADATLSPNATIPMPLVSMSADGSRFVVGWENFQPVKGNSPFDPAGTHVPFVRLYDGSGSPVKPAIQVIAYDKKADYRATGLGMDADGDFAVMMTGGGTSQVQRYTKLGAASGKAVQVAALDNVLNGGRSMAMNAAGNFVVVWANQTGIYAQRFNATAGKIGAQITVAVDPPTPSNFMENRYPSVAMNDSGKFIITWNTVSPSGSGNINKAQAFNSDGSLNGGIKTFASSGYGAPVAMDAAGDATFAWTEWQNNSIETNGTFADKEIRVRRLSAAGDLSETQIVNTTTQGQQFAPSVAAHANGFIVSWSGYGAADDQGVFAQRYTLGVPAPSALASGLDAALLGYLMSLETDDEEPRKISSWQ